MLTENLSWSAWILLGPNGRCLERKSLTGDLMVMKGLIGLVLKGFSREWWLLSWWLIDCYHHGMTMTDKFGMVSLWLCQHSYWTWPSRNSGFTQLENGGSFHSYVSLPEGTLKHKPTNQSPVAGNLALVLGKGYVHRDVALPGMILW